jgi:hypothetical protein
MDGFTALTVKQASGTSSGSGNNTMIAAVASKKIALLGGLFMSAGIVDAKLQDGAGGTDKSGLKKLIANMGWEWTPTELTWVVGSTNTLLNLNLSAAISVAWEVIYAEIT